MQPESIVQIMVQLEFVFLVDQKQQLYHYEYKVLMYGIQGIK